jgi:hypothetical protein
MSWLNANWAGLAFKVVWNVVLMAHITGMRSSCWADTVSRSWATRWLECRRFPITWWVRSSIPLAWGFLTVVSLDWIPYDWRSSWNLVAMNPLSHCHVNNQPVRGSNRAKLGRGSKRQWYFPCFSMLQFPWSAYSSQ